MEKMKKIYYTDEGFVCDRYPLNYQCKDKTKFIEVTEDEETLTLICPSNKIWKVIDGKLKQVSIPLTLAEKKDRLRAERESECFLIVNRGQVWYNMLTKQQKEELDIWYQEWLNVTDTLKKPIKPEWL